MGSVERGVGARLVTIDDLHKVRLTGPVQAYVRSHVLPIVGGHTYNPIAITPVPAASRGALRGALGCGGA
jgi:hypothetical protein